MYVDHYFYFSLSLSLSLSLTGLAILASLFPGVREGIQKLGSFLSLPATILDTEEPAGGAESEVLAVVVVVVLLLAVLVLMLGSGCKDKDINEVWCLLVYGGDDYYMEEEGEKDRRKKEEGGGNNDDYNYSNIITLNDGYIEIHTHLSAVLSVRRRKLLSQSGGISLLERFSASLSSANSV